MKSDLSCNTVQDLLPIYLDEIASEETNICVKEHLSECQICANEYKKNCEIREKNGEVVINEAESIKKLRKRVNTSFIIVIILGIILTSILTFCFYVESRGKSFITSGLIQMIIFFAGIYLVPLFGVFIAVIWKKTISKKEKAFWPNVIISFLGIWALVGIVLLLGRFFLLIIRGY
ncbi:zf-HC2 domain-containing protein [Clostridium gasigenes]|uniref:zf-HC2 domain-containing protein n=1 Tax=Clostridium gasigenes TaxID=94869 RepID=UPI001C0BFD73|nr:zf-HC2 domain-containing protein [Clostridium gasigenes]MBU3103981.1 zf-HC2 domain-containing protein [Clostridium gasigenes]